MQSRVKFVRLTSLLSLALMPAMAMASNDCCWDWSPTEPGANDTEGFPGPKNKEESAYAQCIPTPKADCFKRQGRQMIWVGWQCLQGGVAPDTQSKGSNPNAGWYCWNKAGGPPPPPPPPPFPPPPPWPTPWPMPPPPGVGPLGQGPLVGQLPPPNGPALPSDVMPEPQGPVVPATSAIGYSVLALVVVIGGAWLFRRQHLAARAA